MWTSPAPIPSRIPSTPWKTDTRTAGASLPSFFPSCPHSAGRTTPVPCVTFSRSIPGCSFFILSVHTSQTVREHQEAGGTTAGRDKDAQAAMARCCHRRADAPVAFPPLRRNALKTSLPRPIPSMASVPLASGSGPHLSGLRPLTPRAKIGFCPCPAAGTGAPVRPRASASTVPAGDAVQTLPRIIP